MPYNVEHFPSRNLTVKESTAAEIARLDIAKVGDLAGAPTMPPLPQTFSIQNEMTAVEDQGAAGTCTSFCVVACLEHMHQRDLSEGQVTHEAERTYGDCNEGLALIHAYQLCANPGAIDESLWPYDASQICWNSPPPIGGAARYPFGGIGYLYNRPRSAVIAELLAAPSISPGLPVTVNIQNQMFSRRKPISASVPVVWKAWPWTGDILMPTAAAVAAERAWSSVKPAAPGTAGWHCIAICGWDNATGRFLFKNSWGPYWGKSGYGTIPYQYLELYSDIAMVGW